MTTNTLSVIADMAERYGMEKSAFEAVMKKTVFPSGKSNEEFVGFLIVAKQYNLNPLLKEIYAFPTKGGGIMPIVSIDGWLNIINSHPQFDGMVFSDNIFNSKLESITCKIYRKDRGYPIEITEYLSECQGTSEPWRKYPIRMLRHKATIQAARYAFGFAGIYDEDEANRVVASTDGISIHDAVNVSKSLANAIEQKKNETVPTKIFDGVDQTTGEYVGKDDDIQIDPTVEKQASMKFEGI